MYLGCGLATLGTGTTRAFPSWAINNVCAHLARPPRARLAPAYLHGISGLMGKKDGETVVSLPFLPSFPPSFPSSFLQLRSGEFHVNIGMERPVPAPSLPRPAKLFFIGPGGVKCGQGSEAGAAGEGRRGGLLFLSYPNHKKSALLPRSLPPSLLPPLSSVKVEAATRRGDNSFLFGGKLVEDRKEGSLSTRVSRRLCRPPARALPFRTERRGEARRGEAGRKRASDNPQVTSVPRP